MHHARRRVDGTVCNAVFRGGREVQEDQDTAGHCCSAEGGNGAFVSSFCFVGSVRTPACEGRIVRVSTTLPRPNSDFFGIPKNHFLPNKSIFLPVQRAAEFDFVYCREGL